MRNHSGGRARVEHHALAFLHEVCSGGGNALLFLRVPLLLFLKRRIEHGSRRNRQRSAMGSLDQSFHLQVIEVLANSDLGDAECFGQLLYQNATLVLQHSQNVLTAFLNQHGITVGLLLLRFRLHGLRIYPDKI